MRQTSSWRFGAVFLALSLAACGGAPSSPPPAARAASPQNAVRPAPAGLQDWRDEVIYFALTDRFANGDPANDNGADRTPGDRADKSNPLGWHGGDLAGIRQKIEQGYFEKLGFTAIWISPVVLQVPDIAVNDGPNVGKRFAGYHGYWAGDFFRMDPHFGRLSELQDLVKVAHRHKLKIVQDVVVNHAGYGSPLVTQHPDWFHTDAECSASANKDQDCPLAGLPDFKQDLPAVTQYLNDFIRFWTQQTGVDGLRMDTMKHVPDGYWTQFFADGGPGDPRKLWTVGEVFNGDPAFLAKYLDTLGAPSVFDFPLYFSVRDNLSSAGGNLNALADVFARDSAYRDPSRLTTFVDNHDVKRFVSEALDRGAGPEEARERLDLALSLIYTVRGTPSVYYGTEIGMAGEGDPYNYLLGQSNREDMNFAAVSASPLPARLADLARARREYLALTHGSQQELWRPNGGPDLFAFRRLASAKRAQVNADPVVVVLNGGNRPVELSSLNGGGIPLLGTFSGSALREITGRASNLRVEGGKLVGTVPPHALLAVSGPAGSGGSTVTDPGLGNVSALQAQAGDGAVKLSWTPASDPNVTGERVYQRVSGGSFVQLNFVPLSPTATSFLARGLTNGTSYDFKVVTVNAAGAESGGSAVSASPSANNTLRVSFTVDARTQGNGQIELRRFDTGTQLAYPMTQDSQGVWKTSLELPLFREIKFKFGNTAQNAKNSGYEAPGQGDRSLVVGDANGTSYAGVYDFTEQPVPAATIEGQVTGGGVGLGNAAVNAAANPGLYYALTFADGRYFLRAPSGPQSLTASAPGFTASGARSVSAPATGVDFALSGALAATKYRIDGDLSDWSAPKADLASLDAGTFGDANNLQEVKVDADAQYLYLALRYRTEAGNSALVYLDLKDGGATSAAAFDAGWNRAASFDAGVDFFLARTGSGALEVRRVDAENATTLLDGAGILSAASGSLPDQVLEIALPWSALGFTSEPTAPLRLYGGLFGGAGYGAGDVVPNATSVPAGSNEIQDCYATCKAVFTTPLSVPLP